MKKINKILLTLTLVIALCFMRSVNADTSGGSYSLGVTINGESQSATSSNVTEELKTFFDGVVTYSKDGTTFTNLSAEQVYFVDANGYMVGPISLNLVGDNYTEGLFINWCKVKISGTGSLKFIPLKYNEDSESYAAGIMYAPITDVEEQEAFVKRIISNYIDLHITYEDGYVYINKNTLQDGDVSLRSEERLDNNYTLKATEIYSQLSSYDLSDYNGKLDGKKLVGLFDISVMDGVNKVDIDSGKYTIRIPITEDMKGYTGYSVVYVKDKEIVEILDARVIEDKYIEFETTHLSEYGVIGTEKPVLLGDMNQDENITITDVINLLRIYLGLDESNDNTLKIGDMNKDGSITITDVINLLRVYLNLE